MGKFVAVARWEDLAPGGALAVELGRTTVALFRVGERIFALADMCSHSGGPLSEGTLSGGSVLCPWHGASFDLASGACSGPPASADQRCFTARVVEGVIELELTD